MQAIEPVCQSVLQVLQSFIHGTIERVLIVSDALWPTTCLQCEAVNPLYQPVYFAQSGIRGQASTNCSGITEA